MQKAAAGIWLAWVSTCAVLANLSVAVADTPLAQTAEATPPVIVLAETKAELQWTLGVLTGPSPFELSQPEGIRNPVLTGNDIRDLPADTLAHPFILHKDGRYFMFFTAKYKANDVGGIGLAVSSDGLDWQYEKIVLQEAFALSYPNVFEWENEVYLIPEANKDSSVRLYRAIEFPYRWRFEGKLLSGETYISPTVFRYKETWWMYTSPMGNAALRLFFADNLKGPWIEHPQSPVVKNNADIARPAGRPFIYDGVLHRLGMDCSPVYGNQVRAFEVTEISKQVYAERAIDKPLVKTSSAGWNRQAMHHVDAYRLEDNTWIAAVDALGE